VSEKAALLAAIEQDRNEIIDFFRGLVRVKTPNPPGGHSRPHPSWPAFNIVMAAFNVVKAAFNIVMAGLVPAISGQFRHASDDGRASFFPALGSAPADRQGVGGASPLR